MSLAWLWQSQGKQNETHQMLLKMYNWSSDGCGTKDVQETKALVERLGSSILASGVQTRQNANCFHKRMDKYTQ